MSMTELPHRPDATLLDVPAFVARVRSLLADLPEDVQQDLTEGLEADLTDQLAEGHGGALGDPDAYARELRTAAGFDAEMARVRPRRSVAEAVEHLLDASRRRWTALVEGLPGDPWSFLVSLRPAWWVARAWVALQVVDLVFGSGSYNWRLSPVPSLLGWGWAFLLVGVLVSVQVGRGKLWPGRGGVVGRVVLLVVNTAALACVPVTVDNVVTPGDLDSRGFATDGSEYDRGYYDAQAAATQQYDRAGLYADGRWVSNVYPYDAAGKPLVGVQLFDQTGKPIQVVTQTECVYLEDGTTADRGRVYYPWSTPTGSGGNVFPVPSRVQEGDVPEVDPLAFAGEDRPKVEGFPLSEVPPVQLPGLPVSKASTPKDAYTVRTGVDAPVNPVDRGC